MNNVYLFNVVLNMRFALFEYVHEANAEEIDRLFDLPKQSIKHLFLGSGVCLFDDKTNPKIRTYAVFGKSFEDSAEKIESYLADCFPTRTPVFVSTSFLWVSKAYFDGGWECEVETPRKPELFELPSSLMDFFESSDYWTAETAIKPDPDGIRYTCSIFTRVTSRSEAMLKMQKQIASAHDCMVLWMPDEILV